MTDRPTSNRRFVIRESVDAGKACDLISEMSNGEPAFVEQIMFYPYYCFEGSCSVPGLFGRRTTQLTCLVDAVNGLGATADHFSVEHRQMNDGEMIGAEISIRNATRTAQRTVTHRLTRRLRMLAPFGLTLQPRGIIYKGFWIVRSASATVMVDSVTGGLHPLSTRDAPQGGGFDAERDIAGITVNRWPHGYAYEYNELFDPKEWSRASGPHQPGAAQIGRISIANSDASASAYVDGAIDAAARAVSEQMANT